ncbi:hypothetical protein H0H93_014333, partial [Arthromyces matolae]
WTDKHAKEGSLKTVQDIDQYYRQFCFLADPLRLNGQILESDVNLYFYKGIPKELRLKIYDKFPDEHTSIHSPPSIDYMHQLLLKEFSPSNINAEFSLNDLVLNFDQESQQYSQNATSKRPVPPVHSPFRQAPITSAPPQLSTPQVTRTPGDPQMEELARRLEQLTLLISGKHAPTPSGQTHAPSQQHFQATVNAGPSSSHYPPPVFTAQRCGMCGYQQKHPTGYIHCNVTYDLIREGLVKLAGNKVFKADGTDLPRSRSDITVAQMLRDEKARAEKGKIREVSTQIVSSTSYAGLQINGEDVNGDLVAYDTPGTHSAEWNASSFPAETRSKRIREARFDPTRRPETKNPAESSEPMILQPAKASARAKGKAKEANPAPP